MQHMDGIKYQVNDYVMYGGNGVCVVEDIRALEGSDPDTDRIYYQLRPLYEKGSKVYAPVDNLKSTLRALLSEVEIHELMAGFRNIEPIQFKNDKTIDMDYRSELQSYHGVALLRVMKTAFLRMKKRQAANKKNVMVDEKYFNKSKELLFGECAVVLQRTKEEVAEMFSGKMVHEEPMENAIA